MSTILKALKQAEKDNPDQGGGNHPSFNVRTTLSSRIQQQKQSSFLNLARVKILAIVFIVMTISFYPLFFRNNHTPPERPYNERPQKPDTHPEGIKNSKQAASGLTTRPFNLPESSNRTVLKPEPVNQVPAAESISINAEDKIILPSDSNPEDRISEDRIIDRMPSEQKLPFLENESLRIQAISWSEDPAHRIAVINNTVLQEGNSVQGYRLVIIEKDSVILQYSGKDYRLEFKYQ